MTATMISITEEAAGWERALYAFLAEKERRSGSRRTADGHSRTWPEFEQLFVMRREICRRSVCVGMVRPAVVIYNS